MLASVRSRAAHASPLLVFVLAVSACTSSEPDAPRIVQPGAPGEDSRELTLADLEELDYTAYSPQDVAFIQGMMVHHAQALEMNALIPDRVSRQDVPLLARRIDASQEAEIEQMRKWLEERDEQVPNLMAGHDHGHGLMPGMLSHEQMLVLEDATGEEFDRLYLQSMIFHHQGALIMVDDLYSVEGGGTDLWVSSFANHVVADQTIEILRMQRMLEEGDVSSSADAG